MDRVRAMLHAAEVHRAGILGRGIVAAVLDTGISRHPDYAERIIDFRDFVGGRSACYDDASHGTHVAGILAGDGSCSGGRYCGIAPGCRILSGKVLDHFGAGEVENLIRAVEWVLERRREDQIRILNISAGTTGTEMDGQAKRLVRCVEQAWDEGLVVIVAAGNQGPGPQSITVPGNSRKVITVGALDHYSGCGPTEACVCKPELIAPGTRIVSCCSRWSRGVYYTKKSGTSMAAPAVAGAVALLLEAEPELTNVEVKMRLKEAAVDTGISPNCQGWGVPDLRRLIRPGGKDLFDACQRKW